MTRIWNSIVGKLWATILLLVSFVLFIFTVAMLEFLDDFHIKQAESSLKQAATTISNIVAHTDIDQITDELLKDLLNEDTNAIIALKDHTVISSYQSGKNQEEI